MCYTCGCGMPDDDHGDPKRITTKSFETSGKVDEMSAEDAKKNTLALLKKEVDEEK